MRSNGRARAFEELLRRTASQNPWYKCSGPSEYMGHTANRRRQVRNGYHARLLIGVLLTATGCAQISSQQGAIPSEARTVLPIQTVPTKCSSDQKKCIREAGRPRNYGRDEERGIQGSSHN